MAAVRPAPHAGEAMVVLPDPVAARVALQILRSGGNAVDAAVAAGFALAVTHPQAGNLGGGGFMLIRLADGRSFVVDYRETAPAAATRGMFLDKNGQAVADLSRKSYLAVGVPGTVAGLALAREKAGSLSLDRLLAPAVALAEEGFPVPEGLSRSLSRYRERLKAHPSSAKIFLPGGRTPVADSVLVQKDLARTLRLIAHRGPEGFYRGPVAESLDTIMKERGGLLSAADLAGYRAVIREPVRTLYRGFEVISAPPPSAGGIVLAQMMRMLEPHELPSLGRGSSAYIHLLSEVMKRAYADRSSFLGDPDQISIPTAGLLSPSYARSLMAGYVRERIHHPLHHRRRRGQRGLQHLHPEQQLRHGSRPRRLGVLPQQRDG
jgi:gamma-glutamyltranspeptidase/glutathione hydrolase